MMAISMVPIAWPRLAVNSLVVFWSSLGLVNHLQLLYTNLSIGLYQR